MSYDAKHCFRFFRDEERVWSEAQQKCRTEGLKPVQLTDDEAPDVRDMLLNQYGIKYYMFYIRRGCIYVILYVLY